MTLSFLSFCHKLLAISIFAPTEVTISPSFSCKKEVPILIFIGNQRNFYETTSIFLASERP